MSLTTTHQDICLITANVRNVDLFWSASRVVEIAYAAKGYFPKKDGLQKLLHLSWLVTKSFTSTLIRKATTIVALDGEEVIGTLSVYHDSWKFPIEKDFPDAIRNLRKSGAKMVYIGIFATNEEFRGKASLAASLFQEAVRIGKNAHATQALCVVNPAHVKFYCRLGFTKVDEIANMPGLDNAPAVLMKLDGKILNDDVIERMTKLNK